MGSYPVDKRYKYILVKLDDIYIYEFIADFLDIKKKIIEREAGVDSIRPFYIERMVEGEPLHMIRQKVDYEKISNLERVFSGLDKSSLPPITLKKISGGYIVLNGMHRFTMSLLYRNKTIPAQIK